MLAERAAFPPADVATDVHFRAWLGKWEIGRAQAYPGVIAEHLFREQQQHLFQVGERHVFVDVQRLDLMEESVRTVADRLVAVHASRADDADRWLRVRFHRAYLDG